MSEGVFPIERHEASLLHDLGWQSGFGWKDEWDWWPSGGTLEDRDDLDVRCRFVKHLLLIREARKAADSVAAAIIAGIHK